MEAVDRAAPVWVAADPLSAPVRPDRVQAASGQALAVPEVLASGWRNHAWLRAPCQIHATRLVRFGSPIVEAPQ